MIIRLGYMKHWISSLACVSNASHFSRIPKIKYSLIFLRYNSDFSSLGINKDAISLYSQYILKLYQDFSYHQRPNVLQDCPVLLADELGGKPHLILDKLKDLSVISEQLQQAELNLNELNSLGEASKDEKDFLNEIESEKKAVEQDIANLQDCFLNELIQDKELEACDGAVLEVRAGVGGQEAMLFAMELYEMYLRFCDRHGFNVTVVDSESDESGGLLQASCIITSPDDVAYSLLRHEAGTHRVQRVPKTEQRGRLHTSTASVAVIPKYDTSSFTINPQDIKTHFTTSPGAGGQHVNKTMSCALVRHVPTGIQVRCHATRVQLENLNRAMEQLRSILYKRYLDDKLAKTNAIRNQQTKSRERSDKIRTYNFPNNRITDHRIGYTVHNIESVFSGGPAFVSMLEVLDEKQKNADKIAIVNALFREVNIA